jgi:hypothetical protein
LGEADRFINDAFKLAVARALARTNRRVRSNAAAPRLIWHSEHNAGRDNGAR